MRFADYKWTHCEPSVDVILAAAYLEAKGLVFGVDFEVKDAVEKAEARMQIETAEKQ